VLTQAGVLLLAAAVGRVWAADPAPFGLLALGAVAVVSGVAVGQSLNRTPTGFCRAAPTATADVCGPDALVRAVGTFANPNLLAAFLLLALPLAVAGSAALADRGSRLVGTLVVVTGYVAIVCSGSRAAVAAALVGGLVVVICRGGAARRVGLLIATAVLVVVLGGLALAGAGSVGIRGDVWAAAAGAVHDHPFGVGIGRAGAVITAGMSGTVMDHAHNLWLNWLVEAGYPGLVAVLVLTTAAAVGVVRAVRNGSRFATAIGAGLAGFATMSLVDHPANSQRIALALRLVLGLLATVDTGTSTISDDRPGAGPEKGRGPSLHSGRSGRTARHRPTTRGRVMTWT